MKKTLTYLTIIALSAFTLKVNAQSGFSDLLKSSPGDATKLVDAYGAPLFKGLGMDMNSNWNFTAKTHKQLGFELSITGSGAFVPQSEKSFDVTKLGLSNHVKVAGGSPNITPTFGGSDKDAGTTLETFDDNGNSLGTFKMPKGALGFVPAPQIQLTVGVIANTDVSLRFIPKIDAGDDIGSVSLFGFGIKHTVLQDVKDKKGKIVKKAPVDLAFALGYSRLNIDIPLEVNPESGSTPTPGTTTNDFKNQHIEGHFNNFQIQAILSKKFSVITPFVSLAFNSSKADVGALGNYPVNSSTDGVNNFYTVYKDPITLKKSYISGVRADIGFQLSLGAFRLYAGYAAGSYQTVNGGIGVSF